MASNLERYRKDIAKLIKQGERLLTAFQAEYFSQQFDEACRKAHKDPDAVRVALGDFSNGYQGWYSEAKAVVKQLLPDRLDDFVRHYEKPKSRKEVTFENYRIDDALQGLVVTRYADKSPVAGPTSALPHFEQQRSILAAVNARLESSLFDIRQLVQADLFDSDLDAARELVTKGFIRAAGALAGVVLEKHLGQVADNHNIKSKKSHPTISEFNDLLKNGGVLDIPEWRRVQRLGDLRNLCDHNNREPGKTEIEELIDGVDKLVKTLF